MIQVSYVFLYSIFRSLRSYNVIYDAIAKRGLSVCVHVTFSMKIQIYWFIEYPSNGMIACQNT